MMSSDIEQQNHRNLNNTRLFRPSLRRSGGEDVIISGLYYITVNIVYKYPFRVIKISLSITTQALSFNMVTGARFELAPPK